MITILGLPQTLAMFARAAVVGKLAAEAGVKAVAEDVAGNAARMVAVDTGETRDSIEITEEGVVAAGAALYLEFGTYKMAAQPFLRPAADEANEGVAAIAASAAFGAL